MKNIVVITGASSEIGINLINKIKNKNDTFFLLHVNSNKKRILNEINFKKNNFKIVKADFNKIKNTKYFLNQFKKFYNVKNIHFIHLPSSNLNIKQLKKTSWNEINKQISINLRSLFIILNDLVKNNSRSKIKVIILLSKIVNSDPIPGTIDYTIAKYALYGFVKSLFLEFKKPKIFINAISPSMFKSNLINNLPQYIYQNINSKKIIVKISNKIIYLMKSRKNEISRKNFFI